MKVEAPLILMFAFFIGHSTSQQIVNIPDRPSQDLQNNRRNCPSGYRLSDEFTMPFIGANYDANCVTCGQTCCQGRERRGAIDKRIRNGDEAFDGQFPWSVAIFRFIDNRSWKYICGGVLISDTMIATASHCINKSDVANGRLRVTIGEVNININPSNGIRNDDVGLLGLSTKLKKYGNIYITGHGDTRMSRTGLWSDDLALLNLDVPTTKPRICLRAKEGRPTLPSCFGIGHGGVKDTGRQWSSRLRYTQVVIDMDNECHRKGLTKTNNMLCATSAEGKSPSCTIDSGSPVVCRLDRNNACSSFYLAGIFSFHESYSKVHGRCGGEYASLTNMLHYDHHDMVLKPESIVGLLKDEYAFDFFELNCTSQYTVY